MKLSNGRGNEPLVLDWPWELPQTVVIRWTGEQYEAIATYKLYGPEQPETEEPDQQARQAQHSSGIDLGEVHMAVSHDGEQTHILNGRSLRSKRQYQNKLKAKLQAKIDVKKKGSRRRKKLVASKQKQLKKIKNQIKDIEHKQTTVLISTLYEEGVQTVVIGDVRECAASALIRLLPRSRRSRTINLLGQPTYLESKDKGESSMLVKRISLKVCKVTLRKSCTYGETEFVKP